MRDHDQALSATWDGVGGYATFVGTILIDEKTQEKTLSGDLVSYHHQRGFGGVTPSP